MQVAFGLSTHHAGTLTAWSTFSLAVLTAIVAAATATLVYRTREGIRAQQRAAAYELAEMRKTTVLAQRQIEATYRPLLIDVSRWGLIDGSVGVARRAVSQADVLREGSPELIEVSHRMHRQLIDPRRVWVDVQADDLLLSVPLRNVGQGLASIDARRIEASGSGLGSIRKRIARPQRLPAGETTRINVTLNVDPREIANLTAVVGAGRWLVRVPYADFVGGQQTVAVITVEARAGADFDRADTWFVSDVVHENHTERTDGDAIPVVVRPQLPQPGRVLPDKSGLQRWREGRRMSG